MSGLLDNSVCVIVCVCLSKSLRKHYSDREGHAVYMHESVHEYTSICVFMCLCVYVSVCLCICVSLGQAQRLA